MRFAFHSEAIKEYQEAVLWYAERNRHSALRFVEAVEETIQRIVDAPKRWRVVEEDVRCCLTHVFPYAILYTLEADFILILAVMHWSREPGYWKRRV